MSATDIKLPFSIKGRQIQRTKHGQILLIFHRIMGECPVGYSPIQWQNYLHDQMFNWRIEESGLWWEAHWPHIRKSIDVALRTGDAEITDMPSRTWIRIGDDIAITVSSTSLLESIHKEYKQGPIHPKTISSHARIPIDYWQKNIAHICAEVTAMVKDTKR